MPETLTRSQLQAYEKCIDSAGARELETPRVQVHFPGGQPSLSSPVLGDHTVVRLRGLHVHLLSPKGMRMYDV